MRNIRKKMNGEMKILQIALNDGEGGAELSARQQVERFLERGHEMVLAVGYKTRSLPFKTIVIPHYDLSRIADKIKEKKFRIIQKYRSKLRFLGRIKRTLRTSAPGCNVGFDAYPGTAYFFRHLLPFPPDIIHCHSLHGNYFDLSCLPKVSRQFPMVLSIEDMWVFTGGCAYSLQCDEWQRKCENSKRPDFAQCAPHLVHKKNIYAASRLFLTANSEWMANQIRQSILADLPCRTIYPGTDTSIFHPFDRLEARKKLSLPPDKKIVMASANHFENNAAKDYQTIIEACKLLPDDVLCLLIGCDNTVSDMPDKIIKMRFIPDRHVMAQYFAAVDVFLHAAHSEAFGRVVTEAMACGTVVVASAVGGIPEQINGLKIHSLTDAENHFNAYDNLEATGALVPHQSPEAMSSACLFFLEHPELLTLAGKNAIERVKNNFTIDIEIDSFEKYYNWILHEVAFDGSVKSDMKEMKEKMTESCKLK